MAGEGHMNAVNKVLQKNLQKSIDRRKSYKNSIVSMNSNSELKFKEISNDKLEKLKHKIRIESKKHQQKMFWIFVLLTIVVITLFYFLFSDFNIDFSIFSRRR